MAVLTAFAACDGFTSGQDAAGGAAGAQVNTGGAGKGAGGKGNVIGGEHTGASAGMSAGGRSAAVAGAAGVNSGAGGASGEHGAGEGGIASSGAGSAGQGGTGRAEGGAAQAEGAGGASNGGSGGACEAAIAPGTTYRVTVLNETADSDRCHVILVTPISPFEVTAGEPQPPDCSIVPAKAPPPQTSVAISTCFPSRSGILGVVCNMTYPSKCTGSVSFSFVASEATDFNAKVIEGLTYEVADHAPSCLPDIANCVDRYRVQLERVAG